MKLLNFVFIAYLTLLSTSAVAVAQGTGKTGKPNISGLAKMLPAKSLTVEEMEVKFPEESVRITTKFLRAQALRRKWFLQYIKDNGEARPLPYHKKFGITEEEYQQVLAASEKAKLVKKADIKLLVERRGNFLALHFKDKKKDFLMQPIVFNLTTGSVRTPLGKLGPPSFRSTGPEDGGLIGPHQSWTWKLEEGDPDLGTWRYVALTVGVNVKSKREFIHYKVSKATGEELEALLDRLFVYEGSGEK